MIRSVSSNEMLKLADDPPETDDLVVIYDPADKTAQQIVTGIEFKTVRTGNTAPGHSRPT